jgi:hypothetical protein
MTSNKISLGYKFSIDRIRRTIINSSGINRTLPICTSISYRINKYDDEYEFISIHKSGRFTKLFYSGYSNYE